MKEGARGVEKAEEVTFQKDVAAHRTVAVCNNRQQLFRK